MKYLRIAVVILVLALVILVISSLPATATIATPIPTDELLNPIAPDIRSQGEGR